MAQMAKALAKNRCLLLRSKVWFFGRATVNFDLHSGNAMTKHRRLCWDRAEKTQRKCHLSGDMSRAKPKGQVKKVKKGGGEKGGANDDFFTHFHPLGWLYSM